MHLVDSADVSLEVKCDLYKDKVILLYSLLKADRSQVAECVAAIADCCHNAPVLERLVHVVGVNTLLGEILPSACVTQELADRLEKQLAEETLEGQEFSMD